ncbi:aldo/keto reductase [Plantactinospora sp. DSM 117369]
MVRRRTAGPGRPGSPPRTRHPVGPATAARAAAFRPHRRVAPPARYVEPHRAAVTGYEKLCAELGEEPTTVALAWLLSRPGVTAPIVGPRSAGQLDLALRAVRTTLDPGTLDRLDELFPPVGSGGPGPEAWAW